MAPVVSGYDAALAAIGVTDPARPTHAAPVAPPAPTEPKRPLLDLLTLILAGRVPLGDEHREKLVGALVDAAKPAPPVKVEKLHE